MKRIAILCYHSCPTADLGVRDAGGMSVYVRNLAFELASIGVETDIFSRRHDPLDPTIVEITPGARLIHIDAGPALLSGEQLPQYLPDFYFNIQEFAHGEKRRYDLIHSHYWLSGRVGKILSHAWKTPHVATFHTLAEIKRMVQPKNGDLVERSKREWSIASTADATIVSDAHEREALVSLYGVHSERIHVIPCGVDTTRFFPMARYKALQALGLPETPLVLFVGRLDPVKGLDLLLHIIGGMGEWQDLRLLVVGGNPEQEPEAARFWQLSQDMGLGGRVRFEGIVPHEKLTLYYNSATALIMPSYYESFGLVALESMACGTPVVAARVGGLASIVRDWETGCLVQGHCPAPFIQRLEALLSHPELQHSMGKTARQYALRFRWDLVARRTLEVYQQLERVQSFAQSRKTR
jgi:D-inositol-3-phosphate glycosyltransferase